MKNIFFICVGLLMIETIIAQTENVGIGTTNPQAKLDVNGTLRVNDGTQGANKILTSNATGVASWQTLAFINSTSGGSPDDYPGTSIGCMTWMSKNLDVSTYRDGTEIPEVPNSALWAGLTTGAWCYYNNNSTMYDSIYGKLYNWYAVNDPRGLAPEGWHIPSDYEWTMLVDALGGSGVAGGPMKAIGTEYWHEPNLGATNLCNFSAQSGGYRGGLGGFNDEGEFGHYWTCTMAAPDLSFSRNLNYSDMQVVGAATDWNQGYSVRCVKD